jgi:ribosomal protein S27AE
MATEESPQRAYRAACPGCGAPVLFRSAQSTHAVCGYCHSTVVRDGERLSRIGKMADVFDDYSRLQLMASGRWNGVGFTSGKPPWTTAPAPR